MKEWQHAQLARKTKILFCHLLLLQQGFLVTKSLSLLISADLCQSLYIQDSHLFSHVSVNCSVCSIVYSVKLFVTKLRPNLKQKVLSTKY